MGKTSPAQYIALALADTEKFDIVLLQEPWSKWEDGRCETKTHPTYKEFSPVPFWDSTSTRPRVMTYIRQNLGPFTDQICPLKYRDMLWIVVNNITILNLYRDPAGRSTLTSLFS